MFVVGLGFLALFSVISILLGNEDSRRGASPRDDAWLWMNYTYR